MEMEFHKTIMNKIDWLFLDFDGTLVDNLDLMYKIYINFLKRFGKEGNKDEFDKLNGPNLNEIVDYLEKKYNLEKKIPNKVLKKLIDGIEHKIPETIKKKKIENQIDRKSTR